MQTFLQNHMFYKTIFSIYEAVFEEKRQHKEPLCLYFSAGVGRTGTFIAVDYLLDQAKVEGQVDIYHCVKAMRTKRTNMVQTQVNKSILYTHALSCVC